MRIAGFFLRYAVLAALMLRADFAAAQSFRRAGAEFNAVRSVTVPEGRPYTIIVAEFYHQGEIQPDGRNVVVTAGNKQRVPVRVLQLGPGDFCRLAFQTIAGQSEYDIFYGGPGPSEPAPPWTCRDGLLLETRKFVPCNLHSLDALRAAFDRAKPIGADYVDGVFHGFNPFSTSDEPFLSRYTGQMELRNSGVFGLIVSSQDCSFLVIDDKLAASAPGRHGPTWRVMPGSRRDVKLSAGPHAFEYHHAAAGPRAIMVAAWVVDPPDEKPMRPSLLPPEIFRTHLVGRLPAGRFATRAARPAPDFVVRRINDVALPDNDKPLLGVLFRDASVEALTMRGARISWDFGDGQTSDLPHADHVYLRPGEYAVTLSVRRGSKTVSTTNRISVDRQRLETAGRQYTLDDYLKIIETYDPKRLEAASLLQMVLAYEAKSLQLENAAEDARSAQEDPNRRPAAQRQSAAARKADHQDAMAQSQRYLALAVATGQAAMAEGSAARGDQELLELAKLIAPMARLRLGDSSLAFEIWRGIIGRMASAEPKAYCQIAAAEVAVNDLLKTSEATLLLQAATGRLGKTRTSPIAAMLRRVEGDLAAATGDGTAARAAYAEAQRLGKSSRGTAADAARRGAPARSTEEFLREKQLDRAAEEIHAWQCAFPTEQIDGYLTLLYARYWTLRGQYAQAIAQVERLQTVNPDSPYLDQALLLAADGQMRLGRKDRALATLHALVQDHPGSPLTPLAQKNIAILEEN